MMSRSLAVFLSYVGPTVPGIALLLFFAAFDTEPSTAVVVAGGVFFFVAAPVIRIYFAAWYARDKGRSGALGLFALFGLLGWLFLIVTEDRSRKESDPKVAT